MTSVLFFSLGILSLSAMAAMAAEVQPPRNVAGLVTVYHHNSHADVIVSRLLLTHTLDGRGPESPLRLISLYTDQKPPNDISRLLAASHRFPIFSNITEALTLGSDTLRVDGVLLVAEHGQYPRSATGNTQYPKRRFWEETLNVFRQSQKVVPVFIDKHLSDNWTDAKFIYDTAQAMKVPIMAGSSVPLTWRKPAADVLAGAELDEIVALTFGSTDHYGFHALEVVQALAEQRRGGETGIRSVQCLEGEAVWQAQRDGQFDQELFRAALNRLTRRPPENLPLATLVKQPILFSIQYQDGLRAAVLELNGAIGEWTAAWRYKESRSIESTLFWTQEARPAAHFTLLLNGIERMMLTGKPAWNVERTLLTSGTLDALLQSRQRGGIKLDTPHLGVAYKPLWRWSQPPPPPPGRPWSEQ